ncbi:hypothetical protein GYMLUDRAFT_70013 [Collybiopsis luxurians FD-317 M1]|nr:hypothetical protein GYMLUDRAFT_70013 [Collybiopsis luxurians FD-317 M1]
MSTVWFMVDDTDPRLNYSGSWSFIPNTNNFSGNSFDQTSLTGPAFNSTLHRTTGNVTISFRFNGSSYLGVYGTEDGRRVNGSLPSINCQLDGQSTWGFENPYPQGSTKNNALACRADSRIGGSSPGEHELLINVTNYRDTAWYFDYITYESLEDPILDGETLQAGNAALIDASNYSMLTFGSGWTESTVDDSTVTKIPGSTATIKFNGTSVTMFGDLLSNVSNIAEYQVDNQTPVKIQLPGGVSALIPLTNQIIFEASNLSIAEHTVVVTFNGSDSGMPLDVSYFYVQSLTAAQQASLKSFSSGHPNRGAVVGAILGSIIPTIFLIVAFMLYRRKYRQNKALVSVTPFDPIHDSGLITTPLTTRELASALASRSLKGSSSSYSQTEKIPDEIVSAPLNWHEGGGDGPASNLITMKLEQRLAVMRDQLQHQRDRQLAEGSTQEHRMITVHTDSGLRLTEEALRGNHDPDPVEIPPGYTAE